MKPKGKELDDTDKKIIEHIRSGLTYKEMASKVHLSVPALKYRIRVMKEEYNCKTVPQLISCLEKSPS